MFKKIISIAVVVVTCFTVLISSSLPVMAATDDEWVESTPDDPNISYKEYKDMMAQNRPVMMNAGAGALPFPGINYTFGPEFTQQMQTFGQAAPWALGLLLAGDMLLYGAHGLYETIVNDGPQAWSDFCTLITMDLPLDTIEELGWIGEAMASNESFVVSEKLVSDVVTTTTSYIQEVVYGETFVVPDTELRVGVEVGSTFTPASANRRWIVGSSIDSVGYVKTVFGSNDWFEWTFNQAGQSTVYQSNHVIKNKYSDAVITIGTPFVTGSGHTAMSRWYEITAADGASYWSFGHAYGSNSTYTTVNITQGIEWFEFSNTGTAFDGIRYISATWVPADNVWHYTDTDGNVTIFPLDPLGTIMSKTPGTVFPGVDVGVISANPGFPVNKPVMIPPVIWTPLGDGNTIVQPTTNINTTTISQATDIAEDIADEIALDDPTLFMDFIGGFWDSITGLFDWLPIPFTDKLNGVMDGLVAMLLVFVVVFIVDIVWP